MREKRLGSEPVDQGTKRQFRLFTVTFASTSCILVRQCILKIKSIIPKGTGREIFLKGTMIALCACPPFTDPLITNWVKRGDNGESGLIGASSRVVLTSCVKERGF